VAGKLKLSHGGHTYTLSLERGVDEAVLKAQKDGVDLEPVTATLEVRDAWVTMRMNGAVYRSTGVRDSDGVWVSIQGRSWFLKHERAAAAGRTALQPASSEVRAPMTGTVIKVHVEPGAAVAAGDLLVVMEAMKMEYRLEAEAAGRVERVLCRPGDLHNVGALLIQLSPVPAE